MGSKKILGNAIASVFNALKRVKNGTKWTWGTVLMLGVSMASADLVGLFAALMVLAEVGPGEFATSRQPNIKRARLGLRMSIKTLGPAKVKALYRVVLAFLKSMTMWITTTTPAQRAQAFSLLSFNTKSGSNAVTIMQPSRNSYEVAIGDKTTVSKSKMGAILGALMLLLELVDLEEVIDSILDQLDDVNDVDEATEQLLIEFGLETALEVPDRLSTGTLMTDSDTVSDSDVSQYDQVVTKSVLEHIPSEDVDNSPESVEELDRRLSEVSLDGDDPSRHLEWIEKETYQNKLLQGHRPSMDQFKPQIPIEHLDADLDIAEVKEILNITEDEVKQLASSLGRLIE